MSPMKERFNQMSPEQQRLQNLQSLIASLVFGRLVGDGCGVSTAQPFSKEYLEKHKIYKKASDQAKIDNNFDAFTKAGIPTGFSGYGFGYYAETVQKLDDAGFHSSKNIAIEVSREWKDEESLTQGQIDKCGTEVVSHFKGLGINCMPIKGGSFPDRATAVAVVLDIDDPDFLQKIKPDFMAHFSERDGRQLAQPNHSYNTNDLQQYAYEVLRLLSEFAKNIGVELPIDAMNANDETSENVVSMAEHKIEMFQGGLDVMLPVLSTDEKQSILLDIMDRVATQAPDNGQFKQIRRLALG